MFRIGREVHGFCLGFWIWCVDAANVDFESKLCKSIFDRGGTSHEIRFGEEYEGGIVYIEGGILV